MVGYVLKPIKILYYIHKGGDWDGWLTISFTIETRVSESFIPTISFIVFDLFQFMQSVLNDIRPHIDDIFEV